jgi:hypothetical protein
VSIVPEAVKLRKYVRLPALNESRVGNALYPRSNDGFHRSSIHTGTHDIMPVRTRVASDAKQRESRVKKKAETVQKNDLIEEPREPVQPPHGATKSDSILDSFTDEAR